MKKRILFCSEATYLSSGFATYYLEVMKRLHASGKYELAELASYGDTSDPQDRRWTQLPWKFYPVLPNRNDSAETARYNPNSPDQFGSWKFEETCLKFNPDCVVACRDYWMDEFIERSPYRNYYHWAQMPTCDAIPQDEQWIATYMNADAVFTYSDWAIEVLKKQSQGKIKTKCSTPPGADLNDYPFIQDRSGLRQKMGINPDALIVGTVMRNQRRKLYPDLVEAFTLFLQTAPEEMAKRTYLYLHTSWPDVGWDIPRIIKENGVGHRCLFTYLCRNCGAAYPAFFQDARSFCRGCGQLTAGFPQTTNGVSRTVLGEIMNLFDCYVQYSNSEGLGMPQVEAAACGVPVFAVDYSAMEDVVRKLGGIPIKVQRFFREPETHCLRALPDNADFVEKLIDFLSKPEGLRRKMGFDARQAVAKHYSYDKTAQIWMDHFDSVTVPSHEKTWKSPPRIHQPNLNIPKGLSPEEFVCWGMKEIAGRPDLAGSYTAMRMVRDLNWGATLPHMGGFYHNEASVLGISQRFTPFNEESAVKAMLQMCEFRNHWERKRVGQ